MSVRVRIPTPLRAATDGTAEVSVDASNVETVIAELETRYPAIKGRLRDESGALRRFVNLYVNGEDVRFQNGLETSLKSGDELSIVPAVAGGRGFF
jgi:molybdopterin synthase sulfur carrier subunit